MAYCPYCGNEIRLMQQDNSLRRRDYPLRPNKTRLSYGYERRYRPAQLEASFAYRHDPEPAYEQLPPMTERRGPARDANVESDVKVPLLQAGITSLIAAAIGIIPSFAWRWPWWSPMVIGLVTLGLVWLIFLRDHRRSLWFIEQMLDQDLDDEGLTSQPSETPVVRVDIQQPQWDGRPSFKFVDLLGITEAQLYQFACGSTQLGKSLAEETWTPKQNGFSTKAFRKFIKQLHTAGWVEYIDPASPQRGRRLTAAGRSILSKIAAHPLKE